MQAREDGVDQAGVAEDEEPGVGADQKTGPERQEHQLQVEAAALARARDEEREREAGGDAEGGGESGDPDRAPEDGEVEGVGKAGEAFEGCGPLDAAVVAAREEAVGADDGERGGEEEGHPDAGGQEECRSNAHMSHTFLKPQETPCAAAALSAEEALRAEEDRRKVRLTACRGSRRAEARRQGRSPDPTTAWAGGMRCEVSFEAHLVGRLPVEPDGFAFGKGVVFAGDFGGGAAAGFEADVT